MVVSALIPAAVVIKYGRMLPFQSCRTAVDFLASHKSAGHCIALQLRHLPPMVMRQVLVAATWSVEFGQYVVNGSLHTGSRHL